MPSSAEGPTGGISSSAFNLFGLPLPNSPPTPFDSRRPRAAGRKRRGKTTRQTFPLAENSKKLQAPRKRTSTSKKISQVIVERNLNENSPVVNEHLEGDVGEDVENRTNFDENQPCGSSEKSNDETPVITTPNVNFSRSHRRTKSSDPAYLTFKSPESTCCASSPFVVSKRKSENVFNNTDRAFQEQIVNEGDEKSFSSAFADDVDTPNSGKSRKKTLIRRNVSPSSASSKRYSTRSSLLRTAQPAEFDGHETNVGLIESIHDFSPNRRKRPRKSRVSSPDEKNFDLSREPIVALERMLWLKLASLIHPEYPICFEYIFENWNLEIVSKLGEGSFSEVYRVRKRIRDVGSSDEDFDIFKVIPVGGPDQPSFDDMLPEMSMCLAGLSLLESPQNRAPSFLSLRGSHLVQGNLTKEMVIAFEDFYRQKPEETEQEHPSKRSPTQFYVAIYTSYDGCELENAIPNLSSDQRASIVLQITYALAAAEVSFNFEHRDLHLSNIVIKDTDDSDLEFRINSKEFLIHSFGKRAALIDYGMCRLDIDETLHSHFDKGILVGPSLQRKTYRQQHQLLNGDYSNRCLKTNGLWVKFVIQKIFRKKPINSKIFYSSQVNRLYSELSVRDLSAFQCVELLENCTFDVTNSIIEYHDLGKNESVNL